MRESTLLRFCEKYDFDHGALHELPRRFANFDDFSATAGAASRLIRHPDDLTELVLEMGEDAVSQGVRYIEPVSIYLQQ
eukprot:SAG31_NODE_7_length_42755_cov_130.245728_25_plen_79_part_00